MPDHAAVRFFPYEPPGSVYQDVLLAFQDHRLAGFGIGALVEPDPKGPVNQIVSLVQGRRRIKSALWRVPAGAEVKVVRETGGYTITDLCGLRGGFVDRMLVPPRRARGWYVEIDSHTVLGATDSDIWPRQSTPPVPWRQRTTQRAKTALNARARQLGDAIAHRFGYIHQSEARDW
ncbi:hypothetical protein [Mycolicibacterium sphagni]|uniref:Uncharacterized protein n=1 Tax=Mycolicibacterium sphagni TaxID=1786 RepID=A0A255DT78_9MYCO|nr:hypothetical protein [Mycolicibacterium sphagni]OYN80445.1 hypothetical protein CG716_10005 [Mycolicibacterium sphagni]